MALRKTKLKAKALRADRSVGPRGAQARSQLDGLAKLVESFDGVAPAAELLHDVVAVPTVFPAFDWRVEVGGLPVGSISLIYGPSSEGKTPLAIGLGRSFLERGHLFHLIDAERSTPAAWMRQMLGSFYDHPGFTMPEQIGSYEHVRAGVRRWCEGIARAREQGLVAEDTAGLCVVDSIGQLLPEGAWEEMGKTATVKAEAERAAAKDKPKRWRPKGYTDGAGKRLGQIQAGANSVWVKELTPLLADTRCSMAIITRESVEQEGLVTVIRSIGGKDLRYGSGLWLRVESSPWNHAQGNEKVLVGHRHTVQILRSKVGPKRERYNEAWFRTSNGAAMPEGFARPADVLELGRALGAVEERGSHVYFDGESLGNGEPAVVRKLCEDEALAAALEAACRARFPKVGGEG